MEGSTAVYNYQNSKHNYAAFAIQITLINRSWKTERCLLNPLVRCRRFCIPDENSNQKHNSNNSSFKRSHGFAGKVGLQFFSFFQHFYLPPSSFN